LRRSADGRAFFSVRSFVRTCVEVAVGKTSFGRSVVAAALIASGCGGGSPTSNPPVTVPTSTPTPASTGTPSPTPTATSTPPTIAAACPLGKGTVNTACNRTGASFLDVVDAAIDQLVTDRPELFDMRDLAGPREYKVKNIDAYYEGVAANLRARGFCAGFDLQELQVKNTNDFNDQYDIMISQGYVRRGAGSYRSTCSPAAFPLDPEDVIAQVRVAFYGFRCLDDSKVPVQCFGFVTASPKNKNGDDVDSRIHGTQIQWTLRQEGQYVRMDDADVPFNKNLFGLEHGHFALCAIVRGVEGCLNGEVIP
jgi:hypothetical protein